MPKKINISDEVRELERELNELKELHKTAITECTQYTPEEWEDACKYAEPCAVWLDGKQMTQLMKDKERLDWLLDENEYQSPSWQGIELKTTREDIDAAMEGKQS